MGEACEIAKALNMPISFTAYKGQDGSLKIHKFEYVEDPTMDAPEGSNDTPLRENKTPITIEEFFREYRKLKRL